MTTEPQRLRLFLDTGVIFAGCTQPWGASKAVCILVTQRDRYTVVLAEQVEREVQTALTAKIAPLSTVEAQEFAASMAGWFNRVRLERWPGPSRDYLKRHSGWSKMVRTVAATMACADLGTRESRFLMKWTRQRW